MKLISIVTPCYNEEGYVDDLHSQIVQVMSELPGYEFEHIYIDNASTDGTVPILRRLAAADKRVKVIINTRNFGHIRSPFYGLMQAHGDAVIGMASDLRLSKAGKAGEAVVHHTPPDFQIGKAIVVRDGTHDLVEAIYDNIVRGKWCEQKSI